MSHFTALSEDSAKQRFLKEIIGNSNLEMLDLGVQDAGITLLHPKHNQNGGGCLSLHLNINNARKYFMEKINFLSG